MISFIEYNKICSRLNNIYQSAQADDLCLEDVLDILESEGMLETVTTGDIATVALPIMTIKRKLTYESAPPDEEIESWIKANKQSFRTRYGNNKYEQILYATAWTMYNKKRGKTDE